MRYVVVNGEPGARLTDLVVAPSELVESGGRLRLNERYYITKAIIPALDRALSLVGADLRVRGGWGMRVRERAGAAGEREGGRARTSPLAC